MVSFYIYHPLVCDRSSGHWTTGQWVPAVTSNQNCLKWLPTNKVQSNLQPKVLKKQNKFSLQANAGHLDDIDHSPANVGDCN